MLRREPDGVAELGSAPLARRERAVRAHAQRRRQRADPAAALTAGAAVVERPRRHASARSAPAIPACSPPRARCSRAAARRRCPRSATCTCCPTASRRARRSCSRRSAQSCSPRSASARPRSFSRIVARLRRRPRRRRPSVVAATNGSPRGGGALLRVATDVPARVEIEIATNPRFRHSRRITRGAHRRLRRGVARAAAAAPRAPRLLARAPAARAGARRSGPSAASACSRAAAAHGARDVAIGACAVAVRPDLRPPRRAPARRLRLAGRPELPRHGRPARADHARLRGHLARLPGQPAAGADPRALAVRRPARRPRLRRAGRRTRPTSCPWGLAPWEALMERRPLLPLLRRAGRVLGARPAPLQERPDAARTPAQDAARAPQQREWLLRTLAASTRAVQGHLLAVHARRAARTRATAAGPSGFNAERDLLLAHIARARERAARCSSPATPTGRWSTTATASSRRARARSASPRRTTSRSPHRTPPRTRARRPGVVYADDDERPLRAGRARRAARRRRLDLSLVRQDGADGVQAALRAATAKLSSSSSEAVGLLDLRAVPTAGQELVGRSPATLRSPGARRGAGPCGRASPQTSRTGQRTSASRKGDSELGEQARARRQVTRDGPPGRGDGA